MVYKKRLLPKPVAPDCMAPQSSVKHDYSEYTCVCPAISRPWTSKEELKKKQKKTAGSLTSGSERNSYFSPCGSQAKFMEISRGSCGGQGSFGHGHCGIYITDLRSRQDGSLSGRLVYNWHTTYVSLSWSKGSVICWTLNTIMLSKSKYKSYQISQGNTITCFS